MGVESMMGRAPASVHTVDSRRARRNPRLAWISLAILPLAFVGATFLGDGLLTAQGYQSGDSDIPLRAVLRAGVPAVLVLIAPAICALVFGLRARRLGMRAGAIPALVGLVVAAILILINALPLALGL
jgi:hypothetical protein